LVAATDGEEEEGDAFSSFFTFVTSFCPSVTGSAFGACVVLEDCALAFSSNAAVGLDLTAVALATGPSLLRLTKLVLFPSQNSIGLGHVMKSIGSTFPMILCTVLGVN
jgi:hypothetical protein